MLWKVETHSPDETQELGRLLGIAAPAGTVIALAGEMGAGKTYLAKGIAVGLGIKEQVTSPTFTIINEYEGGRLPFYHMDLYRLSSVDEVEELGLDEYFEGDGITVIEWPERLAEVFPQQHIWLDIQKGYDEAGHEWRNITLSVAAFDALWLEEVLTEHAYFIH